MDEPSLRGLLARMDAAGMVHRIDRPVDTRLEAAALAVRHDGSPVLMTAPKGYDMPILAGMGSSREFYAMALGIRKEAMLSHLSQAFDADTRPPVWETGPCKDIHLPADLGALPLLTHFAGDGGPYITSGVAVVADPELGQNMCFHRLMKVGKDRLVARIVEGRGTHTALEKAGELPIAVCIGAPLHVQLAAACSPPPGHDEALIAQGLAPTPLVRAETSDLLVPAYTEIVIEGRITSETADEGPFVDLTQTPDIVRRQPVIEVSAITAREQALYQALVPSSLEHKLLMGMPREPGIFHSVASSVPVKNVLITPGGCSWLHAVVQIASERPGDGRRAIERAFAGHGSLKHCVVVDDDIDIYDTNDVEWAIATRFQASRDLVVMESVGGSSLDPSASHAPGKKALTDKVGIDATIPTGQPRDAFRKVSFAPLFGE